MKFWERVKRFGRNLFRFVRSEAQNRISRRKLLAAAKALAGPLAAWLASEGVDVPDPALEQALTYLFLMIGGWIGVDGVRDWRNRNAEDRRELGAIP